MPTKDRSQQQGLVCLSFVLLLSLFFFTPSSTTSASASSTNNQPIPCDSGWIYDFNNKRCVSLRYEYFRSDRVEPACSQTIGPSVRDVTIYNQNGSLVTYEATTSGVHSASLHSSSEASFLQLAKEVLSLDTSSSSTSAQQTKMRTDIIATGGLVVLGDEKQRKEIKIVYQDGSSTLNSVTSTDYFPLSSSEINKLFSSSSSTQQSGAVLGCLALNTTAPMSSSSAFVVVPCTSLSPFFCQYTPTEKVLPQTTTTTASPSSNINQTSSAPSTPSPSGGENQQQPFFSYVTPQPYDQGLPCLGGWTLNPDDGFCYLMVPAPHLSAFEAESYCNDFHPAAHLASVVDEKTSSFVFKNVVGRARGVSILTGGLFSQSGGNGAWQNPLVKWNKVANTLRVNPMWADASEPALDFGCLSLDPSSEKWRAFPCRNSAPFICSYFNIPVSDQQQSTTSSPSSSGSQQQSGSGSGEDNGNNNLPRPPQGSIIQGSCLPGWTLYKESGLCTKFFTDGKSYGFGTASFCASQFKNEQNDLKNKILKNSTSQKIDRWPVMFLDGASVRNQFPSPASDSTQGDMIVREIVKTFKNTQYDNYEALIGGTFVDYGNFGLWNSPYSEWNRTFVTSLLNKFDHKFGCLQLVVSTQDKKSFAFRGINCDKEEQGVACSHVAAPVQPYTTLPTAPPTTPVPLPGRIVGIDKYPSKHFRVARGSHGCFRLDGSGGTLDDLELLFSAVGDSCDYSQTLGTANGMQASSPPAFTAKEFTKDNGYFCIDQFPINVVRRGFICVRDASRPRNETSFFKTDLTFETVDSSLYDISYREVSKPSESRTTNTAEDGKRVLPLNVGESGVLTLVGTSILPNLHALRLSDSDECNNPVWTLGDNHMIISRLPKEPEQPRFIAPGGRVGLVDVSVQAALDDDDENNNNKKQQVRPIPQRFVVCSGVYYSPDLHTSTEQSIDEQLGHSANQQEALFYTATNIIIQLPSLFIQVEALQPLHVPSPQTKESEVRGAHLISSIPPSGHFDISQFSTPVFAIFGTGLIRGMSVRFVPKGTSCYHEDAIDAVVTTYDTARPIVHGDSMNYQNPASSNDRTNQSTSSSSQQRSSSEVLAFHIPREVTDPKADFDLTKPQKRVLTSVKEYPLVEYDLCAAMHEGAEYTPSPVNVRVLRRSLSSLNGMSRVRLTQGFEGPMSVSGIRFISAFTAQQDSADDHLKVDISTIGRMRVVFAANCDSSQSFYPLPDSFSVDGKEVGRTAATSAADPLSFAVYESDGTIYLIIPPGYLRYATDSQLSVCLSSDWGKNYRDTGVTIDIAPIEVMFVASQGGFKSSLFLSNSNNGEFGGSGSDNGFEVSVARTERPITIPITGYGLNDQQTVLGFQNANDCKFVNSRDTDLKSVMRRATFASPIYRVGTDRFAAASWTAYAMMKGKGNNTSSTTSGAQQQPSLIEQLTPGEIEDMSEPGQTFVFTISKNSLRAIPTPSARLALCIFQPHAVWPMPLQWTHFSLNIELFRVDSVVKLDVSSSSSSPTQSAAQLSLKAGETTSLRISGLGLSGASIIPASNCDKINTTAIWNEPAQLSQLSETSSVFDESDPVSDRGPWVVSPTPMTIFSFTRWKREIVDGKEEDFIANKLRICLRLAGESSFRSTEIKVDPVPLTFQGAKVCDDDAISGQSSFHSHEDVRCDGKPTSAMLANKNFKTQLTSTRTTTMSAQLTGPPSQIQEASLYLELPYIACGSQGTNPLGIDELNNIDDNRQQPSKDSALINNFMQNNRHSTLTPIINGRFTLSPHQLQQLEPGLYKICYSVLTLSDLAHGAEANVFEDFVEATNITFSILPTYPQLFYLNNSLTGVHFYSGVSEQIVSVSGSALEAGMLLRFSTSKQCERATDREEPVSEIVRMPPTNNFYAKFTRKQIDMMSSHSMNTPFRVCLGVSMFDPFKNIAGTRWIVSRLNVYKNDWIFSGVSTLSTTGQLQTPAEKESISFISQTSTLRIVQSNDYSSMSQVRFRIVSAINGPLNLDSTPSLLFSPVTVGVRPCIRGTVASTFFDDKVSSSMSASSSTIVAKIPSKLLASAGEYHICFQAAPGSSEFVLPSPLPETFAPLSYPVVTRLSVVSVDVTHIAGISGYDTRTNSQGESEKANVVIKSYLNQLSLAGPGVVEGARIALLPRLPGVSCELFPSWKRMPFSTVFSKEDSNSQNKTFFISLFNTMTDPLLLASIDDTIAFVGQQNQWKALVCISTPGSATYVTAQSAPLLIIESDSSWWVTKVRATATRQSASSILASNLDENSENSDKSRRVTVSVSDALNKLEVALRNVEFASTDSAALPSPVTLPLLHLKGYGFSSSPTSARAEFALLIRKDISASATSNTEISSGCRSSNPNDQNNFYKMKKVFKVAGTGTDLYLDFESVSDMQRAYQQVQSHDGQKLNFELCWDGFSPSQQQQQQKSETTSSGSSAGASSTEYWDDQQSTTSDSEQQQSSSSSGWSQVPTALFDLTAPNHHQSPLILRFVADSSSFATDNQVNANTAKSSLVRFDNVVDATIPCNSDYNVPVVLRLDTAEDHARVKSGFENGALKLFYRYVPSTATTCGRPASSSEVSSAEYFSSDSASMTITLTTSVKPKTTDEMIATSEADEGAKICYAISDAFGSNPFSMKVSPLTRSTACLSGFSKSTLLIEGFPLQATVDGTRGIRPDLQIKIVPKNLDCSHVSHSHSVVASLDTSDSLSLSHLPLLTTSTTDSEKSFMICLSSDRVNFAAQPQVMTPASSLARITSLTPVILSKSSDQVSDPTAMQSLFDLKQSPTRLYVPRSVSTTHLRVRGLGIVNSVMSLSVADSQTNQCGSTTVGETFPIQASMIDKQLSHIVVIPTSSLRTDGQPTRLCLVKGHPTGASQQTFVASTEFEIVRDTKDDIVDVLSSVTGLRNDVGAPELQPGRQLVRTHAAEPSKLLDVSASSLRSSGNSSSSNTLLSLPDICTVVTFICGEEDGKNKRCDIPRSRAVLVSTPTLVGSSEDYCSGAQHSPLTTSPIIDGTMIVCPPPLKKPQDRYTAAICVQTAVGRYRLVKTAQIRVSSPTFKTAVPLNGDFEHLTSPLKNLIVAPRGTSVVVGLTALAPSASQPQIVRFGSQCASSTVDSPVDYDKVFPIEVVSDGKIIISAETTARAKNSISLLTSGDLPPNVWTLLGHFSIPTCISVDGGASFQQLPQINLAIVDDERDKERRFRDISVLSNTAGAITLRHYRRIVIAGGSTAQVRPSFPDGSEVRISPSCDVFKDDQKTTPTFIVLHGSISLLRQTTAVPRSNLKLCVRRQNLNYDEDGNPIGIPFDGTKFESSQFLDSGVRLTIVDASVAVVNLQLQHLRAAAAPETPFVVTLVKGDPIARVPVVFKSSAASSSTEGLNWLRKQVLSSRVMVRIGRPCDTSASMSFPPDMHPFGEDDTGSDDNFGDVPLDAYGSISKILDPVTGQSVDAFEAHFSPSAKQVEAAAMRGDSVAMCISIDTSGHFVSITTNVQIIDRAKLVPVILPAGIENNLKNISELGRQSVESSFDLPVGVAVIDPCLGEFVETTQPPVPNDGEHVKLQCDPAQVTPIEFKIARIVSRSAMHGPTNLGYLYDMRLLIPANKIELTSSSPSSRSIETKLQLYDIRATSKRIQEDIMMVRSTTPIGYYFVPQYIPTRLSFIRTAPQIWCIGEDYVTHGSLNTQVIFSGASTAGYRIGLSTCRRIPHDSLTQRNITSGTVVALVDAPSCSAAQSSSSSSIIFLSTGDDASLVIPKRVAAFVNRAKNVQTYHGYKIIPVCNYIDGRVLLDSGVYISSTKELSVIEVNEMTRGLIPVGQRTDFRFDLDGPGIRSEKRVFIRFMPVLRSNPRRSCETTVWPNFWETSSSNNNNNRPLDGNRMFTAIGGNIYISSEDTAFTTTEENVAGEDGSASQLQVTGRVICYSTDGIFFKTHPGVSVAVVPPVVRGFVNTRTYESATSLVLTKKSLGMVGSSVNKRDAAVMGSSSSSSNSEQTDVNLALDLESMMDLGWPEKFESSSVNLGPVPPIDLFPTAVSSMKRESLLEEKEKNNNAFLSEGLFERRRITGRLAVEATRNSDSEEDEEDATTRILTAPFISSLPDERYTGTLVFTNASSCSLLSRFVQQKSTTSLNSATLYFDSESSSYFVTSSVPVSFANSKIVWDEESLKNLQKTFDYVGSYRQHLYDIQPGKFRRPGIDPLPKKEENLVTTTLAWRVCSTVDNSNFYSDEELLRIYSLKDRLKSVGVDALAPLLKESTTEELNSVAAEHDVAVSRVVLNPESVGFFANNREEEEEKEEDLLILRGATNPQMAANQVSQYLDQISIALILDCPSSSPTSRRCNHDALRRSIAKKSAELVGLSPSAISIQVWHARTVSPSMRIATITLQFSPSVKYSLAHATNVLYKALDKDTRKPTRPAFLPINSSWTVLGTVAVDANGQELVSSRVVKWAFIATMLKPAITASEFAEYNRTAEGRALVLNYLSLFSIGKWMRLSMLPTDVDAAEFPPRSSVTSQLTDYPLRRAPDANTHRTSFSGAPTFANGQTYFGIFVVIMLIPSFFIVVGYFAWKKLFTTAAIEEAASVRTKHVTKFQMPSKQLEEIISPTSRTVAAEKEQRIKKEQEIIEMSLKGEITRAEMEEMMRRHRDRYQALDSDRAEANKKFVLEDGEWRGVIADEDH